MKTTTHICDRCGTSGPAATFGLYGIGVGVTKRESNTSWEQVIVRNKALMAEWCEECLKALHLDFHTRQAEESAETVPTIEDIIREIVQEEIG